MENTVKFFVNCQHRHFWHICHLCGSFLHKRSFVYVTYHFFCFKLFIRRTSENNAAKHVNGCNFRKKDISNWQICQFCVTGYFQKGRMIDTFADKQIVLGVLAIS